MFSLDLVEHPFAFRLVAGSFFRQLGSFRDVLPRYVRKYNLLASVQTTRNVPISAVVILSGFGRPSFR